MPNTLVHLGIQGALCRAGLPSVDLRWVFLGCIIPDFPWILRRALNVSGVDVDPYRLMSYATVQASLLYCVIIAAAFALLSRRFWLAFAVLAGNSAFHLLLDAMEIKPGNGVHFVAPLSWEHLRFDLLWPHSPAIYAITALGLAVALFVLIRYRRQPLSLPLPTRARTAAVLLLVATYLFTPLWLTDGPFENDNHFMRTLQETELRPGRRIEIDRGPYEIGTNGAQVRTFAGEALLLRGEMQVDATAVSLSGVFVDRNTVQVEDIHATTERFRSFASIAGLTIVAGAWLIGIAGRNRQS